MHAWESIQSTIDYIEEHLTEKIEIEELAEIACLSTFYFQRLFTRLVGRPVKEYIRMRRLAKSCDLLREKSKRILDVALVYSFANHESFTKAFKRTFGITPEEYRKKPVHLNCVIKPELLLNYTMIDENMPFIFDSIVLEITRKKLEIPEIYFGLSSQVPLPSQLPIGEATGIDVPGQLWESFHKIKDNIPGLLPNGIELGASVLGEQENTFTYFVGASALADATTINNWDRWELPANEYVVCRVEAATFTELTTSSLDKAMKYLIGTWLPSHKLISAPFSAEKYYRPLSDYTYMEIWIVPVSMENVTT